jgi:hypothetical protein
MIALALLAMLAGCSSPNAGVECIQQVSDGGCIVDVRCGETQCPAGETLLIGLDAGTCFTGDEEKCI